MVALKVLRAHRLTAQRHLVCPQHLAATYQLHLPLALQDDDGVSGLAPTSGRRTDHNDTHQPLHHRASTYTLPQPCIPNPASAGEGSAPPPPSSTTSRYGQAPPCYPERAQLGVTLRLPPSREARSPRHRSPG